jgi:peptidoglycan/xylan/chitin deacetylase (PgdA/CDA1 family)
VSVRLSILIYHRVLAAPDPLFPGEVDARRFDAQMRVLRRYFRPLALPQALEALARGELPGRAVAVTFDDGYADNLERAQPIAARHGVPLTVFVASGYLDGGIMWNDAVIEAVRRTARDRLDAAAENLAPLPVGSIAERRAAIESILKTLKYLPQDERERRARALADRAGVELPRDLMLSTDALRRLRRAGATIGAHTVSHPILTRLSAAEAREQMRAGRARLQSLLDDPIDLFAYPNGKPHEDYDASHARMAQELGFSAALTTAWGAASAASDRYQLPRFTPWDPSPARFGLRLLASRLKAPPPPLT